MSYALDNALFQWQEGERGVREEPRLEAPLAAVLDELRRRLGSTFQLTELAGFYGEGTDWAHDLAHSAGAGDKATWVVDAAFNRYAREAADYAGRRA
jgi:hypothetical protein